MERADVVAAAEALGVDGEVDAQALVDDLGKERDEGRLQSPRVSCWSTLLSKVRPAHEGAGEGEKSLEEGLQRGHRVGDALLSLQSPTVKADVPA